MNHTELEQSERRHAAVLRASVNDRSSETGEPPEDMDVFRMAMVRQILTLVGLPLRCREPVCRRRKRCAGPTLRCDRDFPAPAVSEEESARALADFYHALKRRAAELDEPAAAILSAPPTRR